MTVLPNYREVDCCSNCKFFKTHFLETGIKRSCEYYDDPNFPMPSSYICDKYERYKK